ncbi:hypothetical protein [Stieleria sedimenti]|uniref:hypothetical protein n=1 Tax=Stieleria sedimenti TaxID=2976331 RepID=UPI0021805479|nr:hypothetical protein [Stieleria sedimenti]
MAAPSDIHVLESPELVELIDLGDTQVSELDPIVQGWKTEYQRKKQKMDALPPEDQVSRRGWPPTRDRELHDSIASVLDEAQLQRFSEILALWTLGPVQSGDAFRLDRTGELRLSVDQHVALHKLNTRWVLDSFPKFTGRFEFSKPGENVSRSISVRRMLERWEAITELAVKFKPERDRIWKQILSPQQIKRWRELALQTAFSRYDFRVLLEHAGARRRSDRPNSGTSYDYLVPYFIPPPEVFGWSEDQIKNVRAIIGEYESQPFERPRTREAWAEAAAARRELKRRYLQKIEAVMTVEQRQRWRGMLGDPASFAAEKIFGEKIDNE